MYMYSHVPILALDTAGVYMYIHVHVIYTYMYNLLSMYILMWLICMIVRTWCCILSFIVFTFTICIFIACTLNILDLFGSFFVSRFLNFFVIDCLLHFQVMVKRTRSSASTSGDNLRRQGSASKEDSPIDFNKVLQDLAQYQEVISTILPKDPTSPKKRGRRGDKIKEEVENEVAEPLMQEITAEVHVTVSLEDSPPQVVSSVL